MMSLSLIDGVLPTAMLVLGAAALLWLGFAGRKLGMRRILVDVLVALAVTGLLYLFAEVIFSWWDASLPRLLYLYCALAVFGVQLALPQILGRGARLRRRAAGAGTAVLVLLALACTVNLAYAQYPTTAALFSPPSPTDDPLPQRSQAAGELPAITEQTWSAPANMPAKGKVFREHIPAAGSGYASNPALIYLPPAYLANPGGVNLPVLVLIHGQPGTPQDWLVSGGLADMMNSFASRHHGLAPIVVLPDASNAGNRNWPLCLDTTVSRSATYLAQDLPAWIKDQLGAGTADPHQWAVGGYSYGGTCAVQLAANHPEAYPTFLDISGEEEATIAAGHQDLLDTYFGGSEDEFRKQNAVDRFKTMQFPGTAGIIVVGKDDSVYAPEGREVYDAAKAAGMDVQLQELPGGHSWQVWRAGLENNLDWLGTRLGILEQ